MRSGERAAYRMLQIAPEEMPPMTPEQLAEIRSYANAATGGPWGVENLGEQLAVIYRGTGEPVALCGDPDSPGSEANAVFIGAARTAVPELVDEVERLRAENQELRYALRTQVQSLDLAAVPPPLAEMRAMVGLDAEGYPK